MRRLRWIGAALLAVAALTAAPGGPAAACACGGVVSPDLDARVTGEQALVALDGGTETIIMRLNLQSVADNAALIVPTPTPATASLAGRSLFTELNALTTPRVAPGGAPDSDLDEAGGVAARAPTVVAQVQLGPLEATTLTGGDLTGVRQWLDSHGYTMRPELLAQLDPYLHQGWSFVAMRLSGDEPLSGELAPVKFVFSSDRMVYPMRMSAAAKDSQQVVIHTLGAHRMQRTDPDAAHQDVTVDFAGSIAGRTSDETLTALVDRNPYLTRISTVIRDPASITSDFEFSQAPNDDPYQQVIRRGEPRDVTPLLLVGASVGVILIAAATLVILLLRRRRSGAPR